MNKKVIITLIILILIFIILNFYKSNKNIFNDFIIFSLWQDENKYVINPENEEGIHIDVLENVYNGNKIQTKIAPGSQGKFTIKLKRPVDSQFQLSIKDITRKPQNLVFELENIEYNSIEQMQEQLSNILQERDKAIINWKWKYSNNFEDDMEDTKDGENAQKYIFEIKAIVEGI